MKIIIFISLLLFNFSAYSCPKLSKPLNINSASKEKLVLLPGIGPKKAEAIIKFRKKRPFRHVVELTRIKGIGKKRYWRIKKLVTIE